MDLEEIFISLMNAVNHIAENCTVGDLAEAMRQIFSPDHEIKIIGIRHGEKIYETLLTKEEFFKAQDMGHYYRVSDDNRDLNYDLFYVDGDEELSTMDEYNSHNTYRLNVEEIKDKLLNLDYIREQLNQWGV